jgi:signal recognition particle receptor subunit beta
VTDTEPSRPKVAIVGTFQVGKSTLMNCLLADDVVDMGDGLPTTHVVSAWRHGSPEVARLYHGGQREPLPMDLAEYRRHDGATGKAFMSLDRVEFVMDRECLRQVDILDTPGLNAAGAEGEREKKLTIAAVGEADACLVVVKNQQLSQSEHDLIQQVEATGKPYAVVMNCFDNDPGTSEAVRKVRKVVDAQLASVGASPVPVFGSERVWTCNVGWYLWAKLDGDASDGRRHKLSDLDDRIERFFRNQKKPRPEKAEILRLSNVTPVIDFVAGTGPAFLPLPARLQLCGAFTGWRQELAVLAREASCLAASGASEA